MITGAEPQSLAGLGSASRRHPPPLSRPPRCLWAHYQGSSQSRGSEVLRGCQGATRTFSFPSSFGEPLGQGHFSGGSTESWGGTLAEPGAE